MSAVSLKFYISRFGEVKVHRSMEMIAVNKPYNKRPTSEQNSLNTDAALEMGRGDEPQRA